MASSWFFLILNIKILANKSCFGATSRMFIAENVLMMVLTSCSFTGGDGRFGETYSFRLQNFNVTLGGTNNRVETNCRKEDW